MKSRKSDPAKTLKTLLLVGVLILASLFQTSSRAMAADTKLSITQSERVTLTELRDLGLIIMQIKQQAKNIYMEATRKQVHISAEPKIEDLEFINNADINAKADYLPTRPEWLTFYVGTMEPIIHLFEVNTKNTSTGEEDKSVVVPKSTKTKFISLLKVYDDGVDAMNKNVSIIFDNISEKNNNIKTARAAVNIYETADKMENARKVAFKLIKNAKDKNELVRIYGKERKK